MTEIWQKCSLSRHSVA